MTPRAAPASGTHFSVEKEKILSAVNGDEYWQSHLRNLFKDDCTDIGLHLAVFVEPYLGFLLKGTKTVESRFSTTRLPPFGRVNRRDVILLKESGGPVVGLCEVEDAWFYRLDSKSWRYIIEQFEAGLAVTDSRFWKERQNAEYATLIRIGKVRSTKPIEIAKKDRRGWVILQQNRRQHKLVESG
jgi:hypothetical protein